jgi:hypothetical protein
MKPETEGKIKYGSWGLVCGAIIAMIIGFAWGGWSTAGTTQRISDDAVLASQAAICVAQFMKDPNHGEMQEAFEKIDYWKRSEFIEEGGWNKMPGQVKADFGVAQACSDRIELLMKE